MQIELLGSCIAHQLQSIVLQLAVTIAVSFHTDRKQPRTLGKP